MVETTAIWATFSRSKRLAALSLAYADEEACLVCVEFGEEGPIKEGQGDARRDGVLDVPAYY